MADKTLETTVFACKRLPSSSMGNPRFELTTAHGTFKTQSNAAVSYEVTNYTNKIPGDGVGLPMVLRLSKSDAIIGLAWP